ncbi:slide-domain-containing protein, partial [Imleria badia]
IGSRVLIFSQVSRLLDILEDYYLFCGFRYCDIDGSTMHDDRIVAIDEYNKLDSEKFIGLLTPCTGALGINLTSTDIVILYDSEWNPQADLQAMERARRIGRTKQVYVFQFITEGSLEERILGHAAQKHCLDQFVMQRRRQQQSKAASKDERLEMITHGAEKIINASDDSSQQWEGKDFKFRGGRKSLNLNMLSLSKRERKLNYSVDCYFKDTLRSGPSKTEKAPKMPRAPKQVQIQDFQFFDPALAQLQERELAVFKRLNGIPVTASPEDTPEKLEAERAAAQEFIVTAEPLTEEEQALREQYTEAGLHDWSRRDSQQTDDYDLLASEIQDKDPKAMHRKELAEHPCITAHIAKGEAKRNKRSNLEYLLTKKFTSVEHPLQEVELNYPTTKGKVYPEEDRYLLCRLNHYGMRAEDVYECIRWDISEFVVFHFDWFFKSRSTQELQRRCNTLLVMIEKEAEALAQQEGESEGKGKVGV